MNSIILNSCYEYPLEPGRFLIEASAGTGKTWTITKLFRRLITEKELPVSRILVTTFSKPAAAELKERIELELNDALQNGWDEMENGKIVHRLPEESLRKKLLLQLAISSMDEMTIGTLHSFCQKMLREFVIESGKAFDETLLPDNSKYQERLLNAFCRERFYNADEEGVFKIDELRAAASLSSGRETTVISEEPKNKLKGEVFQYMNSVLKQEKEKENIRSFDDLIFDLRQALEGESGAYLAEKIRRRFSAIFVDEFQDTDYEQFEILDRCFPREEKSVLFYMIGDPKQAIYGFRGADIQAYLEAKKSVDRRFSLTKNFRSTPAMIQAVNRIFSDGERPEGWETPGSFLQQDIPFVTIAGGRPEKFPNQLPEALRLRHYVGTKDALAPRIMADVAEEISRLLSPAGEIQVDEETPEHTMISRPLKPSDIAVLLPTHQRAAELLAMLNARGISASACKSGKIYDTEEAQLLYLLLSNFLEPKENQLRALGLSPFFRLDPKLLAEEKFEWETVVEKFRHCGSLWREHGLFSAFFTFMDEEFFPGITPRRKLLEEFNGQRRITNFLQLVELLCDKAAPLRWSPEEILNYLALALNGQTEEAGNASPDSSTDDAPDQLRLDRDSEAVQLLTLFASKGLEYPVVFIPFPAKSAGSYVVGQSIASKEHIGGKLTLDFDKKDALRKTRIWNEALCSQLRLLYVALTRGKYATYLYTQELPPNPPRNSANFVQSAQGEILMRPPENIDLRLEYLRKAKTFLPEPLAPWFDSIRQAGSKWKEFRHDRSHTEAVPETPQGQEAPLAALKFDKAKLWNPWRSVSFSSYQTFLQNQESASEETAADREQTEMPEALSAAGSAPGSSFRALPAGPRFGSMVHRIFELLSGNFSAILTPRERKNSRSAAEIAESALREFGFAPKEYLAPVLEGVAETLRHPLPELGCALTEIPGKSCTAEYEFWLNAPNSLELQALLKILKTQGSDRVRPLIGNCEAEKIKGMLNGFIDLIFEHNGKYWIVDWKTNRLGSRDRDYAPEEIAGTMADHFYILQYHLYSAALLLLLRQHGLPDDAFGGVFYLFPRGIRPESSNGIWFDRPPSECLQSILELFQKGEEK